MPGVATANAKFAAANAAAALGPAGTDEPWSRLATKGGGRVRMRRLHKTMLLREMKLK